MGEFYYWDDTIKKIINEKHILIYGAGMMGNALYRCLSEEPYNKNVLGFIVEKKDNNPSNIGDVQVMDLNEGKAYRDYLVLVALHDKNIISALEILQKNKFTNFYPVTFDGDVWTPIRGNWIRNKKKNSDIMYLDQLVKKKCKIYVACSEYDKQLNEIPTLNSFEQQIQVGASLAKKRIFPVCDDMGENISAKNRMYCELTALYWMWKHDTSQYLGLSHYRRRFHLSGEELDRLIDSGIDFVVTMPIVNFAGVKQQYALDHELSDWKIMMNVIHIKYPEYEQAALEVESGNYYYGYNMFIAHRDVLDSYCKWLFAILEECEKYIGKKQEVYQNRYIGFLSERLLTVFIKKNSDLKVVVTDKHFVEK